MTSEIWHHVPVTVPEVTTSVQLLVNPTSASPKFVRKHRRCKHVLCRCFEHPVQTRIFTETVVLAPNYGSPSEDRPCCRYCNYPPPSEGEIATRMFILPVEAES
jgi:hypothetical protein